MMLPAIGVFAAPASRLTKPMAESMAGSTPSTPEKALPAVAPTKKSGVPIPPLPPKLSVALVNADLTKKAYQGIDPPSSACCRVSSPRPKYASPIAMPNPARIVPAISAFSGRGSLSEADIFYRG